MITNKIASILILVAWIFLGVFFLTGCTTLGISFETEYGRFTYELPEPKGTKK
jgi:hypothetical protein